MKKLVFQTNFDRLVKLHICTAEGILRKAGRSQADGFMDLVLEPLPYLDHWNKQQCHAFSIAHYFKQNGDLCQEPEMVLFIHPTLKTVEAFSFQQAMPPVYQVVYPEPGKVYPKLQKDLNSFLRQWLTNLTQQGHGRSWIDDAAT